MKRLLPFALAGALAIGVAAPAAAQPNQRAIQTALVGLVVQAVVRNVDILNDVDVDVINVEISDSLNNLLQNADIDIAVLNNSLNNVLQNVDVNIEDIVLTIVGDDLVVTVNLLGGDSIVIT